MMETENMFSLHSPLSILLVTVGGIAFVYLVLLRIGAKLGGGRPCPYALAWMVDNPLRRRYTRLVLDWIGIQPCERVLELGPGPGAFTIEAARRTEPGGTLVAVDIQPKMIVAVERKVSQAGLTNVETHVASAYDLPLDTESIDRAFLVTVLPEIPDRQRALAEIYRVLRSPEPACPEHSRRAEGKPGGILSITEEFLDPDYPLARTTTRWAKDAGFELEERHGNWWIYTLNFRKAS